MMSLHHSRLRASTDESATEAILKAMESVAHLSGRLQLTTPRDAFITAVCKASLPPHYTLTVLHPQRSPTHAAAPPQPTQQQPPPQQDGLNRQQVVAVGTALPTASLPTGELASARLRLDHLTFASRIEPAQR